MSETVGAIEPEKRSSWCLKIQVLGMYCCVNKCVISGVRKDCGALIFKLRQLK